MTTHTWIEVGGGLALGINAVYSFFKLRAMRGQMTRRVLYFNLSQSVIWMMFGVVFFSGLLLVFYLAALAAMDIPIIIWTFKLPKDDHVA